MAHPLSSAENSPPSSLTIPATGDKRPAPRGTSAYPRKHAVTACQVCRARRTKCENAKSSCSFCLKVGAVCVQSPVDLSSFDPASIRILGRLNDIEDALKQCQSSLAVHVYRSTDGTREPTVASVDQSCLLPAPIEAMCRWPVLDLLPCFRREEDVAWNTRKGPDVDSVISIDDLQPSLIRPLLNHVKNPVLDERNTRRLVTGLCADGLDWSPHSCLALFVLALGAIATTFGTSDKEDTADPDCLPLARSFARAAQKRLGLTIEGPDRVLEAQCHFFAGVYPMTVFERDGALHALACCQSFQFLRLPRDNQPVSDLSEPPVKPSHRSLALEQAIYWSSWKSERELRMQMDIADFSLCPADMAIYPSFFPTPPRTVSDQAEAIGNPIYDREQLSWYFYLSEISLRRLTSCIVSGILNFKASSAGMFLDELAHATCMYESQGEDWALRLPQMISIESPPEADGVCHFVLRGHLLNLQEVMYWPFVDALITEGLVDEDQYLVRSLARKGLQNHMERLWVNRPGYKHRHHGTLFLLRNCTRSALVLIAAALSNQSQLDRQIDPGVAMPVGWREAVSLGLEMTLYWKDISVHSAYLAKTLEAGWKKAENY